MRYVSTRGRAPQLGFCDTLLTGLARDGGLYLPESWPRFSRDDIAGLAGLPYAEAAERIIAPFIGDEIAAADLKRMCAEAYAGFRSPAVAPLTQIGPEEWILQLFHGPTLSFKDVAMQLLARLMDHVLAARKQRATIVGATSGDTGSAALAAFRDRGNCDIFILYPHGRISEVQRRQMTTVDAANTHAIAIDGTFDDCQAIVKDMFNHEAFRDQVALAGVNSINWARILAQIVYYFTAAVALGGPQRPVAFSVPTGNFGDIFAGHAARKLGLPIARLTIATNVNDILVRTLATGRYEPRGVTATQSPSMDIQVSSNFERLLFDAYGNDGAAVTRLMDGLKQSQSFSIEPAPLKIIRDGFAAGASDEAETTAAMRACATATDQIIDPHTAVGLTVGRRFAVRGTPQVTLATAHPAKFPDAVRAATGLDPALPPELRPMMQATERFTRLPNDTAAVEQFILKQTRTVPTEV